MVSVRYAFLSDIHGNVHALDAVRRFLDGLGQLKVVVLGDLVGYGANPAAVIETVRREEWDVYMGSSDARVAFDFTEKPREGVSEAVLAWTREQLEDEHIEYLRGLRPGGRLLSRMGRVRFCHGSPGNPDVKLDLTASERQLAPLLDSLAVRVLVCGGSHVPYRRELGGATLLDPGSVGLTLNREPGADVAILDLSGDAPEVQIHKVPYDQHAAAFDIVAWGLPEQIAEVVRRGG